MNVKYSENLFGSTSTERIKPKNVEAKVVEAIAL
jgi:hypothetical protein